MAEQVAVAARERGWYILVSDPLLMTPKTNTPGGAAVKGAGGVGAVKSNGVVINRHESRGCGTNLVRMFGHTRQAPRRHCCSQT